MKRRNCLMNYLASVPQRWVVTIMGMLGVTIAFTMRGCLSIAMTQMVVPVNMDAEAVREGVCPVSLVRARQGRDDNETAEAAAARFAVDYRNRSAWDEETQGMILSAFYYGYIVTHIPGGFVAQRFGGKFAVAYALMSTSTLTLLTPTAALAGSTQLMVLRFVEGLGEGITFPALCTLLAQWAPPHEKGKLSTLVFAGVPIGNICANFFSGFIISSVTDGWPIVFYCFGSLGLMWVAVWLLVVYNDPLSHPFISAEECKYLHETIGSIERKKDLKPTPWMTILSSRPVWALVVAEIGFDWGAYTIVNDLPKYMNDVLHFPVKENGFLSSAPYLAQWIMSIVSSVFADFLIKKGTFTVTSVRKFYAVIGTIGPGLGVMGASFVGCNKFAATLCFTSGMALMGFCYPSIRINALDLSPNYSATIMALVNGIGCLSGMTSPIVVGILTPNRTVFEWRLVFWIMLVTLVFSSVIYTIFGSGELQPWDDCSISSMKKIEQVKENNSPQDLRTKVPVVKTIITK